MHVRVHANGVAILQVISQPLFRFGDAGLASFHENPVLGKFLGSLQKITPVRPQQRGVLRHNRSARAPTEPADPLPAFETRGDVFGEMRILRRDHERVDVTGGHAFAERCEFRG